MAQPWEGKKASESIYTSSYMMVTTLQSHCSGLPGAPRSGWRPLAWLGLPAQPRLQHALSPQQGNILLKMLKWKIVDCIGLSHRPPVTVVKNLIWEKFDKLTNVKLFFFLKASLMFICTFILLAKYLHLIIKSSVNIIIYCWKDPSFRNPIIRTVHSVKFTSQHFFYIYFLPLVSC